MEVRYEIWDTETGNLIGEFSTEEEALLLVRHAVDDWGAHAAASLVMGYGQNNEVASQLIEGEALIQRALSATAHA
ncbi:MAG TPA: hypothetical protein VEX37_10705 [Thermomicrobiales bacterium]|nr:hypothetical protein [Thermomicrobiales bacterium]